MNLNSSTLIKMDNLRAILKKMGKVLIAFSGGTDSSLLLYVAADELDGNVVAVTCDSHLTTTEELVNAKKLAAEMGIEHIIISVNELELPDFESNSPDRCYVCKKHRFGLLKAMAETRDLPFVIDGQNSDDFKDYRPGLQAGKELGIRSPLLEAELTKEEIREISREFGLSTWNRAAAACLASRIQYGIPITEENLKKIETAESLLKELIGDCQLRVRDHGSLARIEIPGNMFKDILELREVISKRIRALGYHYVTLDLEGYSMGSLNRTLPGVTSSSQEET